MSRSCIRMASAMLDRRCRASSLEMHCGSSERLPLVSTIGRSTSRENRWCNGVFGNMKPSVAMPGATADAMRLPGAAAMMTIGPSELSSRRTSSVVTMQLCRTVAKSAAMRANGFASRRLSRRRRTTTSSLVASQASWKPPRPFTATMAPPTRSVAAAAIASGSDEAGSSQARGPQAGQAIGCAWKRRSAES